MTSAIEIRGLRKTYGSDVVALDGLDLQVPVGSVFGFLGPNGAGKSTTIKTLLGLIRADGGTATVLGHDIDGDGLAARERIGYLPQQPRFHPYRNLRGVMSYVAHLHPRAPRGRVLRNRIDELLEEAGLAGKARRHASVLSGGERQRLGIAQALIADPELLILDEPAAGLDPQGRHDVLELLERLKGQTTVFFSTHLLDDVQRVSDSVAVIAKGRTLAQGPLDSILEAPPAAYTVRFRGADDGLRHRLEQSPFVVAVDAHVRGDQQLWEVQLADEDAGGPLLDAVLDEHDVEVIEFHPTDPSLEVAYLELVGAHTPGATKPTTVVAR